ncbi:MAG TPA: hypothetical protein PLH97_14155, partial [Verrucomicrobiota bacterium]|nr:hypothetical protein [Verrucomicrobiota bacterium]
NWFVAANWTPNAVPGALDTATTTNNGTYTVLIPTGSVSVANLSTHPLRRTRGGSHDPGNHQLHSLDEHRFCHRRSQRRFHLTDTNALQFRYRFHRVTD